MATNKVQTGIRFEAEMLAKIAFISKRNRRSLNAQLEFLVQKCIEEYELENGAILINDDEKYNR